MRCRNLKVNKKRLKMILHACASDYLANTFGIAQDRIDFLINRLRGSLKTHFDEAEKSVDPFNPEFFFYRYTV